MALRSVLLVLSASTVAGLGTTVTEQLPRFRVSQAEAEGHENIISGAKWWAHVGDHIYTAPPATSAGLSQHVGDYYAAMGSESALSDTMRQRRVGGQGRWHIFHLPEGPAALQVGHRGERRSSFSRLIQLRDGDVMKSEFPPYTPSAACASSMGGRLDERELTAVASITAESFLETLTGIVNIKDDNGVNTRSYSNPSGSSNAQEFLKQQFQSMGLKTCLQKFSMQGRAQANVVAVVPGKTQDTLTVGAHYDSRPFSGAAPGAEDNGSGLAALLSVAKAYSSLGIKPEKTLYFVAFAGEEPGLLGSDHWAQELQAGAALPEECAAQGGSSFLQIHPRSKGGIQHEAIALDEVGWLSPKYSRHTVNLESYDWAAPVMDQLACSSQRHNGEALEVVHSNNPFGSDHMSWLERGMKAVLVINGDDEAYPNYHQSTDTLDNVAPEYAAKISKMVVGAVTRLAGAQSE